MHAFGLEVAGPHMPGLVPGAPPRRRVRLELVEEQAVLARWPQTVGPGEGLTVRRHEAAGWLVRVPGLGTHVVSADGTHVVAHAPTVRLLFAQSLPLAATLQGLELLHAAAVAIDGSVVALVAGSGIGKSSTAARLVARGARFVADDALALEIAADALVAHPGSRLAGVPAHEGVALGPVREQTDKPLVEPMVGADGPLPLAAVLVLDRGAHPALRLEPVARPLALVLAAAFVPYVGEHERQRRLLAVAAAVTARTTVRRVTVPPAVDADGVARAVLGWRAQGALEPPTPLPHGP